MTFINRFNFQQTLQPLRRGLQQKTTETPSETKAPEAKPQETEQTFGTNNTITAKPALVPTSTLQGLIGGLKKEQSGPSYGTIELANGTKSGSMTKADWEEAGLPDAIFEKCFTANRYANSKADYDAGRTQYGLKHPYTGLKESGGGSDKNGSFKIFSASMNDGKNGEVHSQTIKTYEDGTTLIQDNYEKSYPNEETGSTFNSDKLKELGINEEMAEKYFSADADGNYTLKEPYTSFNIIRHEGDTDRALTVAFVNNGNRTAMNDIYGFDKDGNELSTGIRIPTNESYLDHQEKNIIE